LDPLEASIVSLTVRASLLVVISAVHVLILAVATTTLVVAGLLLVGLLGSGTDVVESLILALSSSSGLSVNVSETIIFRELDGVDEGAE